MAHRTDAATTPREAITPVGINHLVLNVRHMEESHAFWTEIMGFKQVGELHPRPDRPNPPNMRFYSGDHSGKLNHHDLALVEMPNDREAEAAISALNGSEFRDSKLTVNESRPRRTVRDLYAGGGWFGSGGGR